MAIKIYLIALDELLQILIFDALTSNYQDLYHANINDYLETSFVNIPFWIYEVITYYISQINGLKSNDNNSNMDDLIFMQFINQTLSNKFEVLSFPMPVARYETTALILQVLFNCMMQTMYVQNVH